MCHYLFDLLCDSYAYYKAFFDILISVTLSLIAYGLTMILMRNEIIRSLVRMIISVVRDK